MVWERRVKLGKVDLSHSERPTASYPGEVTEEKGENKQRKEEEQREGWEGGGRGRRRGRESDSYQQL